MAETIEPHHYYAPGVNVKVQLVSHTNCKACGPECKGKKITVFLEVISHNARWLRGKELTKTDGMPKITENKDGDTVHHQQMIDTRAIVSIESGRHVLASKHYGTYRWKSFQK